MSKKELKHLTEDEYDALRDIGFLHEFYPEATGNWYQDVVFPSKEAAERIDVIGQNGNTGEHYPFDKGWTKSKEDTGDWVAASPDDDYSSTVKNPKRYFIMGKEAIELIRASLSKEEFKGYCLGNALKYRLRAGKKGDAQEDLAKALEYEKIWDKYGN